MYNDTAFDVDQEVVFTGVFETDDAEAEAEANHTVKVFPTTYNGLCKSYEFHDVHKVRTYAGMSTHSRREGLREVPQSGLEVIRYEDKGP